MRVIPSIDLMDGKCVRLVRGEKRSAIAYDKDPIAIANEYIQNGAALIHVVDLDGAFTGGMKNLGIIRQLAKRFTIQVGGGIRSEERIKQLLELGATKAVVSTLLFKDPTGASRLREKYRGNVIGSLDFKNGRLCYAGWTETSNSSFEQVAEGLEEIIVTDVERDGTLTGPNLELLRCLKTRCKARLIAAGGIRDIPDLFELKRIGMDGAIVGKAFLENRIKLRNGFRFQVLAGD